VNDGRQLNGQQTRIGSRPFVGNTFNHNNRQFQVGSRAYQPAHYRHSGYHGYWNGNRGFAGTPVGGFGIGYGRGGYNQGWGWGLGNVGVGYGNRGYGGYGRYGYRPIGWGLGGWGLGSVIYNSGYLGYSNPYYVNNGVTGYNYSQPIPVSYSVETEYSTEEANSADEALNAAVAAFRQEDYNTALDLTDKGINRFTDDAVLHEFRSLVLFAKQDYQQSAATIHAVLAIGPGWDWTTLSSIYGDVGLYTTQLRSLEAYTNTHPQDGASRFLLAYHYMSCGHPDSSAIQLKQVVALTPNDRVASDLLRLVSAGDEADQSGTASAQVPEDAATQVAPVVRPVDAAALVGTWKATRPDESQFTLALTADNKFTWAFQPKSQPAQSFGGTYSVEGNVLALERTGGGSLIAEVVVDGQSKLNFRLLGSSPDDQGLDFVR
jgi:tetratricopeptide (TPR) repeat protein